MNNLKALRKKRGLSLRELSEKVGINHSALSLAENGKRGLNDQDINILCDFFQVSADALLGREDISAKSQLSGLQLALYEGTKELTDQQMVDILKYAEYVKYKK